MGLVGERVRCGLLICRYCGRICRRNGLETGQDRTRQDRRNSVEEEEMLNRDWSFGAARPISEGSDQAY
jgi:hypothetical protein